MMDMELRAVAVDLDFVQLSGTIGRAIAQRRVARRDESREGRTLRAGKSSERSAINRTLQRNGAHDILTESCLPGSIQASFGQGVALACKTRPHGARLLFRRGRLLTLPRRDLKACVGLVAHR
jgi:hypothetical protein